MRKQDLILSILLICFCGLFYYLTLQLPQAAMIYPLLVISILLVLTLIQLFVTYFNKKSEKSKAFEKLEWKQMGIVLLNSFIYIMLINVIGYVVSTLIYVLITLLFLKVSKKLSVMVSVGFVAALYVLFQILLKVPLPKGFLI
ncbi:MAG: tripartite tricarboxylate transporter TctB family protein [Bacillota bacterium]|nr:tripartite tricarboxylate transporter TctB family protein [Bacillota bacterium]